MRVAEDGGGREGDGGSVCWRAAAAAAAAAGACVHSRARTSRGARGAWGAGCGVRGQGGEQLWFPFTQHGRLGPGDVKVIDSRSGDFWSGPARPPRAGGRGSRAGFVCVCVCARACVRVCVRACLLALRAAESEVWALAADSCGRAGGPRFAPPLDSRRARPQQKAPRRGLRRPGRRRADEPAAGRVGGCHGSEPAGPRLSDFGEGGGDRVAQEGVARRGGGGPGGGVGRLRVVVDPGTRPRGPPRRSGPDVRPGPDMRPGPDVRPGYVARGPDM